MPEKVRFRDRVAAFWRALTEPPRAPDPESHMYTSVTRTVTINGQTVEGEKADEISKIMERHHAAVFKNFGNLDEMFTEIDEVFETMTAYALVVLTKMMEHKGWELPNRTGSTSFSWGDGIHWDRRGVTAWYRHDGFAIERGQSIPPDVPVWGLTMRSAIETLEDYAAGRPRRLYREQYEETDEPSNPV